MLPNFTYEIDEKNTVKIYDGINNDAPLIIQPTYPNGDEFENAQTAAVWAENWIENWHTQREIAQQQLQKKQEVIELLKAQGFTTEEIEKLIK